MNLEENLIKYRDITLAIMEMVKVENYENLDESFNERQVVLNNIIKINCSKKELKEFYVKYDIDNLEKILALEMSGKKEELLEKIKENQKRKTAMSGYNNIQSKSVFLSKQF